MEALCGWGAAHNSYYRGVKTPQKENMNEKRFRKLFKVAAALLLAWLSYLAYHGYTKWYTAAIVAAPVLVLWYWIKTEKIKRKPQGFRKLQLGFDLAGLFVAGILLLAIFAFLNWLVVYADVGGNLCGSIIICAVGDALGAYWAWGLAVGYWCGAWEGARTNPAIPVAPQFRAFIRIFAPLQLVIWVIIGTVGGAGGIYCFLASWGLGLALVGVAAVGGAAMQLLWPVGRAGAGWRYLRARRRRP